MQHPAQQSYPQPPWWPAPLIVVPVEVLDGEAPFNVLEEDPVCQYRTMVLAVITVVECSV